MDLSRYLENMKNLPDRFSNLAFWRGVRKLKDKLVETFEYVSEWGNGIEGQILDINGSIAGLKYSNKTRDSRISALESSTKWIPIENAVATKRLNINFNNVTASIARAFEGNFTSYTFSGNPDIVTVPLSAPNTTMTPLCLEVYFEYSEGVGDMLYFPVRSYAVDRYDDDVSGGTILKIISIETTSVPYNIPPHWNIHGLWLDYQIIGPDAEGTA